MLPDVGGWGLASVLDVQSLFFYIKENSIWAMTRDHANHILLTRYLPFDSDVRQWSHLLMIPLHCLWAKSSNKTRSQFECDVALFLVCFCFDFVHSHARCGCCSIVYLHFQNVQIKQVDCKLSTKNVNNYTLKTFRDDLGQLHTQEYKAPKKHIVSSSTLTPVHLFTGRRRWKRGF